MSDKGKKHGLTLAETLVTVVIVISVAGIAVSNYSWSVKKIKNQEAEQIMMAFFASNNQHFLDKGQFALTTEALDVSFSPSKNFNNPTIFNGNMQCTGHDPVPAIAKITVKGYAPGNPNYYELGVLTDSRIVCNPCLDLICKKLGYEEFGPLAAGASGPSGRRSGGGGCSGDIPDCPGFIFFKLMKY